MKDKKTRAVVLAGLLAAFITIGTLASFPLPGRGYANLGDCFVVITAMFLGPVYSFLAAGIGSALADILLGYSVFAPATFLIKGLMALAVYLVCRKSKKLFFMILGVALAELIMISGYFIYGAILFGYAMAIEDLVGNVAQALVGGSIGVITYQILKKTGIISAINEIK